MTGYDVVVRVVIAAAPPLVMLPFSVVVAVVLVAVNGVLVIVSVLS